MKNKAAAVTTPRVHKCALYIRVSTEEQASNPEGSIKSQEQRLRQVVDFKNQEGAFGEISGVFVDRARSGKDTNRQALQRLLQAIRNREVSLVMVTELSRLSRSIKDFCEMWELMRSNSCEFQSLREQFDTTTAAGEMVLYTLANIAQFERKQTSERITANLKARAERGLCNGTVPFGYKLDPEKKGHLLIQNEDAAIVREAFCAFIREGCLSKTARALNQNGFRIGKHRQGKPRLGYFTNGNLHFLLKNRAYLGLRVYHVKGEEKVTKAVWPAIIEKKIYDKVQKTLTVTAKFRRSKYLGKRYPYLLSGIVFCGHCGERLCGKSAHGRLSKVPYYEHSWSARRQACLTRKLLTHEPVRVPATKLENAVWGKVTQILVDETFARRLVDECKKVHGTKTNVCEANKLRTRLRGVDEQMSALAEHLSKIPKNVSPAPIYAQLEKLQAMKAETQVQFDAIVQSPAFNDMPVPLSDYQKLLSFLRKMSDKDSLRPQIIQRLIQKIEVLKDGYRIHFYSGKNHVTSTIWDLTDEGQKPLDQAIKNPTSLEGVGCSKMILTSGPLRPRYWKRPPPENHNNINR